MARTLCLLLAAAALASAGANAPHGARAHGVQRAERRVLAAANGSLASLTGMTSITVCTTLYPPFVMPYDYAGKPVSSLNLTSAHPDTCSGSDALACTRESG